MTSFSLKEASEQTGVPTWTLRRGCANGTYPYIKNGEGGERVHRRFTAEHIAQIRQQTTAEARPEAKSEPTDLDKALDAVRANLARPRQRRAA